MAVARSSIFFTVGTLLSRVVGLIRDRVFFGTFGASLELDAFIIAMRVPGLFRELLAEGSLGSAFTKVFSDVAAKDEKRAAGLLKESFLFFSLMTLVIVALGIWFAPHIIELMTMMAPADQGAVLDEKAVGLSRLLFPVFGFMLMGAVAMGALHQQGRFFLTAVAPICFNLGYMGGAVILSVWFLDLKPAWVDEYIGDRALAGLAVGVLIGAFFQMFVQIMGLWKPLLSRDTGSTRLRFSPELKRVFLLMGPMVIAASSGQVNQVIVTNFSTSLEPGTVTRLQAAFRLLHLPVALFAVALGVTALPALTRAIAKAGRIDERASALLQDAVEIVLWCMVPCLAFYVVNGTEVVALLFQSGRFGAYDVELTGAALAAYAFSLIAYGLMKVLQAFYFSTDRTSYPMKVSIAGVGINFALLYALSSHGIVGLASAFSLSLSINTVFLVWGLRGQNIQFQGRRFGRSMGLLLGTSLLAAGLQKLSLDGWHNMVPGTIPIWLRAGGIIVINATWLCVFLVGGACLYLRVTPMGLIRLIKQQRRRPKTA